MRISDWSSDVCSSDLLLSCVTPERPKGRIRGPFRRRARWPRWIPGSGLRPPRNDVAWKVRSGTATRPGRRGWYPLSQIRGPGLALRQAQGEALMLSLSKHEGRDDASWRRASEHEIGRAHV